MIHQIIASTTEYRRMMDDVQSGRAPVEMTGLSGIHKAALVATASNSSPVLVITPDEAAGNRMVEDVNAFLRAEDAALLFPARELVFRDIEGSSREYEHARLSTLGKIMRGECRVVVASMEAAMQYIPPEAVLKENTLTLEAGGTYDISVLVQRLVHAGYERRDQVDGICQFAQRGGILDFFPPDSPFPLRAEFWGDEIDTISAFDVDTQRRTDTMHRAFITPAREALYKSADWLIKLLNEKSTALRGKAGVKAKELIAADIERLDAGLSLNNLDKYLPLIYPTPATLFDYMRHAMLFVSELVTARETAKNSMWQLYEDISLMLEEGVLFKGCDRFTLEPADVLSVLAKNEAVLLDNFARSVPDLRLGDLINVNSIGLSPWSGDLSLLYDDLDSYLDRGYCCVVLAGTAKAAAALKDDLTQHKLLPTIVTEVSEFSPSSVYIVEGSLSSGLELPDSRFALIAHTKAGVSPLSARKRRKKKAGEHIRSLSDLSVGDLVVHTAHGIGVFEGIIKREIHGVTKDYIKIRYAGTDALFVPVTQLDLVSKYIGPKEDGTVRLNKLNSVEWQNTRKRVKAAVADMAKELIALYAQRMAVKGYSFSEDTEWQREFEERFPYNETDDQLRCIEEIKHDMESTIPMDRLLCGDVGFGKTEVALRGAFKCVMDAKQCAVLVPTTILAWQHYKTFVDRMQGYPINIELLSRFRTPKQQEETIRKLRRGEVDIVIGTHRLLQKDVTFKDLGLCIIDEEQRFGVAHKERFKELRNNVDVLTLSATPIPRTLNMAMSGIRDMSTIEESPQDRHPVQTYVIEHDYGIVAEALKKELRRGGQAFYLHNRVESIDSCAYKLAQLVPDARIVTAHGKMSEEQLSDVWQQLIDHDIDILVCTTIIETGVDVPNCNTLIIEDADRFGLSQLYQLRGRVGRSNRRAYAYLTFKRGKALTDIAVKRLSAIKEFTTFGSGFRIAMRDLEIRGAGNILGANQHGHMEAVGYDMYLKLLSQAVVEQRGEAPEVSSDECLIDIRIGAHIPENYIDNLTQRIDIYKKIAAIQTEEDSMDVTDELIDRFGDPPEAVKGLIDVALIRNIAARNHIYEISQKNESMVFYPTQLDLKKMSSLAALMRSKVNINAGTKPSITVKMSKNEKPIDIIRTTLYALSKE
ncbi:transcription-repair coupling factor [Hydrogenoanaerobacterium sp.]|uniref:transcription-repair coupling factor n=1 Tax=Hydrogenoanaerobacterium sp. TaxID=2953763 RepID=UPI00289B9975|nr:transcription-repair coupling factor [Hydrogenoanaerobacterium sp.]